MPIPYENAEISMPNKVPPPVRAALDNMQKQIDLLNDRFESLIAPPEKRGPGRPPLHLNK